MDHVGLDATSGDISEWRNLANAALDKQMSLIQESIKYVEHVRKARRQRDIWRKRAEIANNPVIRGRLDEFMFIPEIVCLCGSMRFYDAFRSAEYKLELQGKIVLTPSFKPGVTEHGGMVGCTLAQKEMLDDLHKRKIYISDRVLVLNVGGYIGESTRSEIQYAESLGKPVDYLEAARAALEGGQANDADWNFPKS